MTAEHELRRVSVFADLDDEAIDWLERVARFATVEPGEALFSEGDLPTEMIAVLDGELRMRREQGPPDDRVVVRARGTLTGMLPHSRLKTSPVTARALIRSRVAGFSTDLFPEMLRRVPELQARLASVMVDRSREFTRHDDQREKLMSLGKLSAGLAHELNNPAAAIQRQGDELARRVRTLSDVARALLERAAAPASFAPIAALAGSSREPPAADVDPIARSEEEEALTSWLEARGLADAWLAAETLVSAGVSERQLDEATDALPDALIPSALRWLEADLASRRLLDDVADATRRITELIASVKAYSNMDRAPTKTEIDVHEGIRSTLAMLAHRLRSGGVSVRTALDPALPPVRANPGELNQVWTNLIDNAVDAAGPGGEIEIRTSHTGSDVVVEVIDDGPGMAPEVQRRIFEPFFTTKEVGEGTGLGLDIVSRIVRDHDGEVHVESVAGRTRFEVRLPAANPEAGPD